MLCPGNFKVLGVADELQVTWILNSYPSDALTVSISAIKVCLQSTLAEHSTEKSACFLPMSETSWKEIHFFLMHSYTHDHCYQRSITMLFTILIDYIKQSKIKCRSQSFVIIN